MLGLLVFEIDTDICTLCVLWCLVSFIQHHGCENRPRNRTHSVKNIFSKSEKVTPIEVRIAGICMFGALWAARNIQCMTRGVVAWMPAEHLCFKFSSVFKS